MQNLSGQISYEMASIIVQEKYSRAYSYHGNLPPKYSQKTLHSLPVRTSYGVFLDGLCEFLVWIISCICRRILCLMSCSDKLC